MLDFVQRTKRNLELTEAWRLEDPEAGFSEVTQRINSLLGLIVFPRAKALNDLPQHDVTATGISAWRAPFTLTGGDNPLPLRNFVTGLRNAVSHHNLEFMTDGHEISGVQFSFQMQRLPDATWWRASFKLYELDLFLRHLTEDLEVALKRRAGSL